MKNIILCIIILLSSSYSFNFKCKSRYGWSFGYGRYSKQNEYSSYWNVYMNEKEYVLFQYPGKEKVYTFKVKNCIELNGE